MDLHSAFRRGAEVLAREYCDIHKTYGLTQTDWDLLTQKEHWTPDQARQTRNVLAGVVETALTIAGMPAIPLPGQYVAAVIATVVAPANRFVACTKAPDTFDAHAASGILEQFEIKPMRVEQLMALVMAYSGGYAGEPQRSILKPEVVEIVKEGNKK